MVATQHDIRRDSIAVELGGIAEYNVGGLSADVAVIHPENVIDIYEVKTDLSDLQRAIGQFAMYGYQSGRESGRSVLCVVMPVNASQRHAALRWLERLRPVLNGEINTYNELVDLPDCYEIEGEEFVDRAAIERRLAQVKAQWGYAEYLHPENRAFLMALADRYCRRYWEKPATDVTLSRVDRDGILVTVHSSDRSTPVSNQSLIRSWLEIEHYQWTRRPTHVGVSLSTNAQSSPHPRGGFPVQLSPH